MGEEILKEDINKPRLLGVELNSLSDLDLEVTSPMQGLFAVVARWVVLVWRARLWAAIFIRSRAREERRFEIRSLRQVKKR